MRVTRWVAAAAATVVLAGLGGCGGGDKPVADETPSAGSASSAPVTESEEPEPSEPEGVAGGYDADELIAAMKAAIEETQTAHISMQAGGAQGMTGEGDVSYAGNTTAMQMQMQMPQLGAQSIEMRLIDGVMYMAMPPMTPEGKFIKLDTNDPNSPFGDLGALLQGDPMAAFDAFEAGLQKVEYLGSEDVDGEEMDHYVLTVDAKLAARAQGTTLPDGTADTVTYDLWIDGQDLLRRMQFGSGAGGMTMTMSDWGDPVSVKAPPASAVMQMPGF